MAKKPLLDEVCKLGEAVEEFKYQVRKSLHLEFLVSNLAQILDKLRKMFYKKKGGSPNGRKRNGWE